MAAPPVVSTLIVYELLNKHNYEEWNIRVRTYLVAKGFWSVVEEAIEPRDEGKDQEQREAWVKLNAEALHAIHLCCGTDAFKIIKNKTSAYEAWRTLTENFEQPANDGDTSKHADVEIQEIEDAKTENDTIPGNLSSSTTEEEGKADETKEKGDGDGVGNENSSKKDVDYKRLFNAARHGKWSHVTSFLKDNPAAIREAAESDEGKTVLHYAVEAVREDIVQELLPYIETDDDLEITDDEWRSALDYCYIVPEKDGMVKIAEHLIQKKKELNAGDIDPEVIRSLLVGAYILGRPKLADYLYKITPLKNDDPHAAHLISLSFSTKRFDIACDLIQRYPSLAITEDLDDRSPLNELACTPSAFFSGSRLKFWEKLIYHAISIKRTEAPLVKSEEGRRPNYIVDNKGNLIHLDPVESKDLSSGEDGQAVAISIDDVADKDDKDKQSGLILTAYLKGCWRHVWIYRAVIALFQVLTTKNICKFFGIHRIYQMKLNHVRSHEILLCMCQVLSTEKRSDWNSQQEQRIEEAIFQAAERGLVEFLIAIFKVHPDLAKVKNEEGQNIFQVAVRCRQAEVFNLIQGFSKDTRRHLMSMKDDDDNNMLHMMGLFSSFAQTNRIRGAALQMQKELKWFKELEKMARPEDLEAVNGDKMKPRDFFSKNHEEMVKGGEASMKETATSCTVVCALIVTMMFGAAFTIPGGSNENNGVPMFLDRRAFKVFIVADALSLFTSTTSVMLFLGVLTSRYAEEDFLKSLPRKMILGLLTLFLSVTAMMIAFTSALFLLLPTESWISLPTTLLAGVPIASFIWMQFPFLVEIFISTYIPRTYRKENMKIYLGKVRI